ncbi:MAG: Serine/threonine-protein kinase PknD [bacterium]|nr:Serine/threonine-protein kinase PknD [bacterium]
MSEDRVKRLRELFVAGEIELEEFQAMKAQFEAGAAEIATPGGLISDSVIKGNVQVGDNITILPKEAIKQQATMTGEVCGICHRPMVGVDWFKCPDCNRKLHQEHQTGLGGRCSECDQKQRLAIGDVREGDSLGTRYQVKRRLGEGGMGRVFLALDKDLERDVALKVLPREITPNTSAFEDLRKEAQLATSLSHPNLCRLYDLCNESGIRFLKMEYVDGETLDERIATRKREGKTFSVEEILTLATGICTGLDYIHSQKVVHRDLKPANIMLTKAGAVKIMDFGISQAIRDTMSRVSNKSTTGTLMYMSPEQLLGKKLDGRSDLYALGIVLFELAAGHTPFHTGPIYEQHLNAPVPAEELQHLPAPLRAAILQLLMKDVNNRPATAMEALKLLKSETVQAGAAKPAQEAREAAFQVAAAEEDRKVDQLRDAIRLAMADGSISDSEKARLNQMWEWLGIPREVASALAREVHKEMGISVNTPAAASPSSPSTARPQDEIITNSIGMKLKLIQPGSFRMGSEKGDNDERPVHEVRITKPFYLGVYPVTQDEYEAVIGNNPSHFKSSSRPVESVSWDDAIDYCRKLSAKEGVQYRLPSEAEWEYACRAGSTTEYCCGDGESRLGQFAWYSGNSGYKTHPVGQKQPNSWGLYDMHGNVWEWCQDWYHDSYVGAPTDGSAWKSEGGPYRVIRGGDWGYSAGYCRSAGRDWDGPHGRINFIGFRLARTI